VILSSGAGLGNSSAKSFTTTDSPCAARRSVGSPAGWVRPGTVTGSPSRHCGSCVGGSEDVRQVLLTDVVPLAEAPALLTDIAARRRHVLTAVFTTTDEHPG